MRVASKRRARRKAGGRARRTHLSIILGTNSETIAFVNGYAPKIAPVITGPAPSASRRCGRMGANTDAAPARVSTAQRGCARAGDRALGATRALHAGGRPRRARTQAAAQEGARAEGDHQVALKPCNLASLRRGLGERRHAAVWPSTDLQPPCALHPGQRHTDAYERLRQGSAA